jgi:hypothetical protein
MIYPCPSVPFSTEMTASFVAAGVYSGKIQSIQIAAITVRK